jgi:hypothetical protein
MVVPEWIRSVGNGRVELLARREPREATYVAELFLYPNYAKTTLTDTAAPWFTALLTSRDGSFQTLIEAAQRLDNPAVVVEIYRYRKLDHQRVELTNELDRISITLTSLRDGLNSCRCYLEWAQVPVLLQHLQDRMSFTPPSPPPSMSSEDTVETLVDFMSMTEHLSRGGAVSPPAPGTNWVDWSNTMGREMYLHWALAKLNAKYPPESNCDFLTHRAPWADSSDSF